MSPRIDLEHLDRVRSILGVIPRDYPLPYAIIAMEDAIVACKYALALGLTIDVAREQIQTIRAEEIARR